MATTTNITDEQRAEVVAYWLRLEEQRDNAADPKTKDLYDATLNRESMKWRSRGYYFAQTDHGVDLIPWK